MTEVDLAISSSEKHVSAATIPTHSFFIVGKRELYMAANIDGQRHYVCISGDHDEWQIAHSFSSVRPVNRLTITAYT